MATQDYYETLGVGRAAGADEIKRAYRRLAKQFHPDRNPDKAAEEQFRRATEAYEVLSDDEKRATYDRFGAAAFSNDGGPGPFSGFGGFQGFGGSFADVFDDLFGEFRGRRAGTGGRNRGSDLRYNLEIGLEDAYSGRPTQIKVPGTVRCDSCGGSGAAGNSGPSVCGACGGAGRIRAQQGFFSVERTCPTCHGAGQTIRNPCTVCSGSGRVRREKTLSVNIPAGVEDSQRIRLAGEGEAGLRGGPAGDLYIFLSVRPHPMFQRDGRNLHCRVHIPMATAALGGTVDVPSLDGSRTAVTVPAGTQCGRHFRLKGKGMPAMRGGDDHGDLFVEAVVETPVNLTRRQRELLREFAAAGKGRRNHPESESFLARLREFWEDLKD